MDIIRAGSVPSGKGPTDWFTGTVRIDPLFNPFDRERVGGAQVTFEPGARTAWHTHPLGQTLIVTSGLGYAQRWGGELANSTLKPMINQILAHVSNTPFDLIDYLKDEDILVEAYSPVGHGKILDNPQMRKMAERYGVTIPQLAIRYVIQLGLVALPKTANPDHMRNNADVTFEISEADMATLKAAEPIKDYGDASMFPVYSGR